jgi:glycosyltransferase involved in cell wall biosynthesis
MFLAMRPGAPLRSLLPEIDASSILETRMLNAADVLSSSQIAEFAKTNNVEIIHAHVARDYTITALAARLAGKPFVLTRHVLFPMKRLHRFVLGRVGAIIAPSTAVFDGVRREGVLPADRVTLIHNGVDINFFAPRPRRPRSTLTIGTIGHLGKLKGHDIFIRAAAISAKQDPDLKFIITGEDKNRTGQSRDALARLIDQLGMQDRIKLAGWAHDIRVTLKETDIFVSAARTEPFGLSIAEAMATSVPVIATASEGASEIIVDGESGIIVPLEDPASLAGAILRLAADEVLRERIGKGGRERIVEHFSLDQMVGRTEALYERVVNEHSGSQR